MQAVDLIRTKRDGGRLSDAEVRWFIDSYTHGRIADEQASAMLMAIVFRGLDPAELSEWTAAMIESGDRMNLSTVGKPTVDKHSTGGVGDKVSLVACPLVAACGAAVPQLSGRGLGHTGGTLDKLEAISGWQASLTPEQMLSQLHDIGLVICAAGAGLAPADRKLYALRDVTATVESIPLIASSIMSKKIAEGTESLVLNVTFGSGAFMKRLDQARELAETMVRLGAAHGVRTTAVLSRMDTPLGRSAGNALEITESIEALNGGGPNDLREITLALAREMLTLVKIDIDPASVLQNGQALGVWNQMIRAQGGDPDAPIPVAAHREIARAEQSGYITRLDAFAVGVAAWRLGAGRSRKEDPVSPIAGVVCLAKPGDVVERGQPILELHIDNADRLGGALEALIDAITIAPEPIETPPLIADILRS
jgi:thymidine phosphorylase